MGTSRLDDRPEIKAKLLSPQIPHVNHLLGCFASGKTVCVDGSDAGTGKTYSSAATCAVRRWRPLICSPKQTVPNWYRVCELFGVEPLGVVNYETLKNGKYYDSLNDFYGGVRVDCPYIRFIREIKRDRSGTPILTAGGQPTYKVVRIEWNLPADSVVIFDEVHRGKNGLNGGNTLNSKLMVSIRPYLGAAERRFGLIVSATLTDKYENFDVAGYILGLYKPHVKKVYDQFVARIAAENGGHIIRGLHKLLYPSCGSRMTIANIKATTGNAIFKENDIKAEAYTIDTKTAMQIEYLHQEIQTTLAQIRAKGTSRGFGYIIRCWQKIETMKVPAAVKIVLEQYNSGKSIVIFTCFKATKRLICQQIAQAIPDVEPKSDERIPMDQIGYIDGDQTAEERESVVQSFSEDRLRVLICQIVAGGESLSFHDVRGVYQRFTLCFPTWSAIGLVQALGRTYRANAKSDSIQRIFYIKPVISGFGKEAIGLETVTQPEDTSELPDFELLDKGVKAGGTSGILDPAIRLLASTAWLEEPHLTVEEKICMCVNTKCDNIAMLNDGVLSGQSLFGAA